LIINKSNILFTLGYLKVRLRDFYYRNVKYPIKNNLSSNEKKIIDELFKKGIYMHENYWDERKCNKVKNKLLEKINLLESNYDFPSGAYYRVNRKDAVHDVGVGRIYCPDKELTELVGFKTDAWIKKIIENYYGFSMYSVFTAFQYNKKCDIETRGFHIDGWTDEFKCFIYLDDVDISNGPFSYIKGSNNFYWQRFKRLIKDSSRNPDTSFISLGGLMSREEVCIAKKGTLIMVDVKGLHRGLPQLENNRSLVYNNFHPKNMQQYPEK